VRLKLSSFPAKVSTAINKVGDACYYKHNAGKGKRVAHVIHVVGPDFRGRSSTSVDDDDAAVTELRCVLQSYSEKP
jgi:hypothetical protein